MKYRHLSIKIFTCEECPYLCSTDYCSEIGEDIENPNEAPPANCPLEERVEGVKYG